jgi:hypothetical protein
MKGMQYAVICIKKKAVMETLSITLYDSKFSHELDDFADIIITAQFKYNTGHLLLAGLSSDDIGYAMGRAMKVCKMNGIDPRDHFRSLYVFDEKNSFTYCDWKMTREGFTLVVMNSPSTNEAIAHWQWEMVVKCGNGEGENSKI